MGTSACGAGPFWLTVQVAHLDASPATESLKGHQDATG